MNINLLCMGCMNEKSEQDGKCPFCGYDNTVRQNLSSELPIWTILNGEYVVGKSLGTYSDGTLYLGFDLNKEKKVIIKKYREGTLDDGKEQNEHKVEHQGEVYYISENANYAGTESKLVESYENKNVEDKLAETNHTEEDLEETDDIEEEPEEDEPVVDVPKHSFFSWWWVCLIFVFIILLVVGEINTLRLTDSIVTTSEQTAYQEKIYSATKKHMEDLPVSLNTNDYIYEKAAEELAGELSKVDSTSLEYKNVFNEKSSEIKDQVELVASIAYLKTYNGKNCDISDLGADLADDVWETYYELLDKHYKVTKMYMGTAVALTKDKHLAVVTLVGIKLTDAMTSNSGSSGKTSSSSTSGSSTSAGSKNSSGGSSQRTTCGNCGGTGWVSVITGYDMNNIPMYGQQVCAACSGFGYY